MECLQRGFSVSGIESGAEIVKEHRAQSLENVRFGRVMFAVAATCRLGLDGLEKGAEHRWADTGPVEPASLDECVSHRRVEPHHFGVVVPEQGAVDMRKLPECLTRAFVARFGCVKDIEQCGQLRTEALPVGRSVSLDETLEQPLRPQIGIVSEHEEQETSQKNRRLHRGRVLFLRTFDYSAISVVITGHRRIKITHETCGLDGGFNLFLRDENTSVFAGEEQKHLNVVNEVSSSNSFSADGRLPVHRQISDLNSYKVRSDNPTRRLSLRDRTARQICASLLLSVGLGRPLGTGDLPVRLMLNEVMAG